MNCNNNKKFKKAKSKNFKKKKYSLTDRHAYYAKKAQYGKTSKEQDYAMGYLDGMRGIRNTKIGTDAGDAGNAAGLRFWNKLIKKKI